MIKKTLILLLVSTMLSGCNLVISYFDSAIPKDNHPEPTPRPTQWITAEPTAEPTLETTEEPTLEPTTEPSTQPLVLNGDFETGDKIGWEGSFVISPASANTGTYCARMNTSSAMNQIITGLTPDTDYIISFYTKLESVPATGSVVLQDFCDVMIEKPFPDENSKWNYTTIPFTLSTSATSLMITFYCALVNVSIDDVVMVAAD